MKTKSEQSAEILKKVAKRTAQPLVVSELLENLMSVWGGPAAFANSFQTEFNRAQAGSMVRSRMLGDILRLFIVHTASLKGTATTVEGLSDEELSSVARELLSDAPEATSA